MQMTSTTGNRMLETKTYLFNWLVGFTQELPLLQSRRNPHSDCLLFLFNLGLHYILFRYTYEKVNCEYGKCVLLTYSLGCVIMGSNFLLHICWRIRSVLVLCARTWNWGIFRRISQSQTPYYTSHRRESWSLLLSPNIFLTWNSPGSHLEVELNGKCLLGLLGISLVPLCWVG